MNYEARRTTTFFNVVLRASSVASAISAIRCFLTYRHEQEPEALCDLSQ